MKKARLVTDQYVVNVYVHIPMLRADGKTSVVLIAMDNLWQVYYLKTEHVQTMCGLVFTDYHSGADIPDWVHTLTRFDLRGTEYSEDSRMWWAISKSKSMRTRFGFNLVVPPKKADESSLSEAIQSIMNYIGGSFHCQEDHQEIYFVNRTRTNHQ